MSNNFAATIFLSLVILFDFNSSDGCNNFCVKQDTCYQMWTTNKCYYVFKFEKTWSKTNEFCQSQGLEMVVINREMIRSGFNITGLFKEIPYPVNQAWLGSQAMDYPRWMFLNNTGANGVQFFKGQFQRTVDEKNLGKCGTYHPKNLQFGASHCYEERYFLCRFDPCWYYLGQKCILLIREKKTWFEARTHCIYLGGDLYFMKSGENKNTSWLNEQYLIDELRPLSDEVHIGLRHRKWQWRDGSEVIYTNWKYNEPNTFQERCMVMIGHTGKWNDDWCHTPRLVLCEGGFFSPGVTLTPIPATGTSDTTTVAMSDQTTNGTDTALTTTAQTPPSTQKPGTHQIFPQLVTILASLLGLVFVMATGLAIFYAVQSGKCRCRCRSSNRSDIAEFIDNNYYDNFFDFQMPNMFRHSSGRTMSQILMDLGETNVTNSARTPVLAQDQGDIFFVTGSTSQVRPKRPRSNYMNTNCSA